MTTADEAGARIVMLVDNPNGSQELYHKLREHMGLDAPAGGILHVAGPSPAGGWRVIEVFESQEAANRFIMERFVPALKAVGAPGPPPQPQFWPVHALMT